MPLHPEFRRCYTNTMMFGSRSVWLAFTEKGLLCREVNSEVELIQGEASICADYIPLGELDGVSYAACAPSNELEYAGSKPFELRGLFGRIPLQQWLIAGYAAQILHWRKTSGYCPVCGAEMGQMGREWVRKCTECGHERFPQVSPCPAYAGARWRRSNTDGPQAGLGRSVQHLRRLRAAGRIA